MTYEEACDALYGIEGVFMLFKDLYGVEGKCMEQVMLSESGRAGMGFICGHCSGIVLDVLDTLHDIGKRGE